MQNEPIFVVGAPRSGTTLLAAMLAAHTRLSCGPETHFFRWLSKVDSTQMCQAATWPMPAVDFICSITYASFSDDKRRYLIEKYQTTKQQVLQFLSEREPSVANMLASITEPYMQTLGKSRWVEKTPDHIEYLHLIRAYFPKSPIVRIVRDPRDVALSLASVPWGTKTLLEGLAYWKRCDDNSRDFFATDDNSYTLHFEALVSSPERELQRLCRFIGEEFETGMLNTSETGKQVNSRNVPWKAKASQSVDTSRLFVWRRELTTRQNRLAEAYIGDRLEEYGYPREETFPHLASVYPSFSLAVAHAADVERVAAHGLRFWKAHEHEAEGANVYIGNPGDSSWLGRRKLERIARTLSLSARIVRAHLFRQPIFWLPTADGEGAGWCAYLLTRLLAPHRLQWTTDTNP